MKLIINRKVLAKALASIKPACSPRGAIPILGCAKLNASDGYLTVSANDTEVAVAADVPAQIEAPGVVCAPLEQLLEITKTCTAEALQISLAKAGTLKIQEEDASGSAEVPTFEVEEFPVLPAFHPVASLTASGGVLRKMFASVESTMPTDKTRYNLNGVYLAMNGETRMVATDGYRLVVRTEPIAAQGREVGCILPRKAVEILHRHLPADSEVILRVGGDGDTGDTGKKESEPALAYASVLAAGWRLRSRLIDGTFPNYERVIPKDDHGRITVIVDRLALQTAIKRVLLKRDRDPSVALNVVPSGRLELESTDPHGAVRRTALGVSGTLPGAEAKAVFNPLFLLEILAGMETERVVMSLLDGLNPAVIYPEGSRDRHLAVVMPKRH